MKLDLSSFMDSGEISISNSEYIVKAKSITTLSEYEVSERKHNDEKNLKIIMIVLTFVLALSSLIQIIFVALNYFNK